MNILYIIATIGAFYLLLHLGNLPYGERHRQWWNPFLALFLSIWCVYEFFGIEPLIAKGQFFLAEFADYADFAFCLIVIGIFAIIKLLINEGGKFLSKRKKSGNQLSKYSAAYKREKASNDIVLRRQWAFPFHFLGWLIIFSVALLLLIFLYKTLSYVFENKDALYIPGLLLLSLLIMLETRWYLQHPKVEQPELSAEPTLVAVDDLPKDYYNLWEEYQQIWNDQLLLAWHYESEETEEDIPADVKIIEAQNLINIGYKLNTADYHIIEQLVERHDLLIEDAVTDKISPLLFTVFLRRLMDGENILVLTPVRCYANSEYHENIVNHVKEWFVRLTGNRDFWPVQVFGKTANLKPSSRIIVTSADDVLEKNVLHNPWFDKLRTVLFLNGNDIFPEYLTSNNVLLNILRNRNKQMQSVVLSDYREALQSSVMRNLDVQRDVKEVRRRRLPAKKTFLLVWRLEGERHFQHETFSGHIEKFLGAEVVLALLPRREQIEGIIMTGQEKLPYEEYLEEVDNQKGSLANSPVAQRTLRRKAVEEIRCEEADFLTPYAQNAFMLAHDEEFNLITAIKKWESHIENTAFLQVVSPPYLLRDYFIDNCEYFLRTPVLALSSKMMISRFEIARKLLERLVSYQLTESEVLEELRLIKPDAVYAKQELSNLFLLAFGIDIVASNHLSVEDGYHFSQAAERYEQTVRYSLLPQIKDSVELSFLQEIEIADEARNILKIASLDTLFQNYLPDQQHAFNGRPYSIRRVDLQSRKLRVNHVSPTNVIAYRPDLDINILHIEPPLSDAHRKNLGGRLQIDLCEGNFSIRTKGYHTFRAGIEFASTGHTYTRIGQGEVPARHYRLGRLAIISINADAATDVVGVTATLCLLLNEMRYTLFPEAYQYIHIGSPITSLVFDNEGQANYFPHVRVEGKQAVVNEGDKVIELCIFEDAHQDVGLVQSFFDKWDYVFRVADDYLYWLQQGENALNDKDMGELFRKRQLQKTAFLSYGFEHPPDFVDIEGTSKLLRKLVGRNYLTDQRERFYMG